MSLSLTSKRIVLRDFTSADWPAVQAYADRPEVYRFQPWGPTTSDEAHGYVQTAIAQAQQLPRTDYQLAIVLVATGDVIGAGSLVIHSQLHRHGEIGYFLHPDYWGQGYATEVGRCLLGFGFRTLGLHRIIGTCDPRNIASGRVLERIGMHLEGRLREVMFLRDGWRDSLLYSVLEHEWHPSDQ
jgi:[ribosomal protein S5]-alanine N-acetyltransferase